MRRAAEEPQSHCPPPCDAQNTGGDSQASMLQAPGEESKRAESAPRAGPPAEPGGPSRGAVRPVTPVAGAARNEALEGGMRSGLARTEQREVTAAPSRRFTAADAQSTAVRAEEGI